MITADGGCNLLFSFTTSVKFFIKGFNMHTVNSGITAEQ